MRDSTERERAQLYAGFLLAWGLVRDTFDIPEPAFGQLENDPAWKQLRQIAAGEVTLASVPEMNGSISWDIQDARDVIDQYERLKGLE